MDEVVIVDVVVCFVLFSVCLIDEWGWEREGGGEEGGREGEKQGRDSFVDDVVVVKSSGRQLLAKGK